MILLGKKDSIFHQLSVQYLTLNQIIIFCEQSSSQAEALNHFFKPLLKNSDLSDMIKLAEEVSTYILILEREQLWTDSGFSELLISKRDFDAGILQLKELGFNFWHELAVKDPMKFLKTCSDLTECTFKDEIQNILSNLTM
jgi:mannitol/fructose-specific phosphotransferase system IIA component (Ntr-type)